MNAPAFMAGDGSDSPSVYPRPSAKHRCGRAPPPEPACRRRAHGPGHPRPSASHPLSRLTAQVSSLTWSPPPAPRPPALRAGCAGWGGEATRSPHPGHPPPLRPAPRFARGGAGPAAGGGGRAQACAGASESLALRSVGLGAQISLHGFRVV